MKDAQNRGERNVENTPGLYRQSAASLKSGGA
jgi:hypothetical protein